MIELTLNTAMVRIDLLNKRINLNPRPLCLLPSQLIHRHRRKRERRVNPIHRINRHEIDAPILVQHPIARSALVGIQPFDEARGADVGVRREGVERGESAGEEAVFAMGAGFTHNFGALTFLRFMSGFCWAPVLAIAAGSLSDTFPPHTRGPASAIFILMPFLGPGLG